MALINCPECNKEISDSAVNCIHCGFTLKTKKQSISHVTVEQTSKPLKLKLLLAKIFVLPSMIGVIYNLGELDLFFIIFSIIFLASAAFYFIVKFNIWWHHD